MNNLISDEKIERIFLFAIICYKNAQIKFKKENKVAKIEQKIKICFPEFKELFKKELIDKTKN